MSELDIVSLIEQNPITKLSGNYHNKLITKIKDKFNDSQQQMFVASFYCFLNCDKKNDFIIDLDNVWKWLGFSQKVRAKELLEKHFKIDIDYKKSLSLSGKRTTHMKGGNNKETFMLNIDTFKKFCLKAGTKKADEVHEYYIQLEETIHEVIQEESNELKLQLENYKTEIIASEKDKLIIREKTLLQQFPNNTQCVYYGIIDNVSDKNEKLIKFGNSNFLKNRVNKHKETYSNFWLVNAFKVDNKLQIENAIKTNPFFIPKAFCLFKSFSIKINSNIH
jgi:phage anti-repressor protein